MTIDKLLGKSLDELEAMSDEEIESYFKPYLEFTRVLTPPTEEVVKVKKERKKKLSTIEELKLLAGLTPE